jgi:pyridoxine kinase
MNNIKVLAINSFAVHGMASLKATISILGSRVLPVPSVILNGLTNMPYVQKQGLAFRELLEGTFTLAVHRNQKLIVYIGYLGSAEQVDVILDLVEKHKANIDLILVDPISGDHGKMYVPTDIMLRWPELIRVSDFAFPNLTELKLITGHSATDNQALEIYFDKFSALFPKTGLIATSIAFSATESGIMMRHQLKRFHYSHALLPKSFGGTGDAFVTYFILYYMYHSMSLENALRSAAEKIKEMISISIQEDADELLV